MNNPTDVSRLESALDKLLTRPIAYHRIFTEITGSLTAGVMLSQAWYWNRTKERSADKSFYKTREEWAEETGMSPKEIDAARRVLKEKGFMTEELKGVPARIHYTLNKTALVAALLETPPEPTRETSIPQRSKLEFPKGQNLCSPKGETITESTTESTTERRKNNNSNNKKDNSSFSEGASEDPGELPDSGILRELEKAFGWQPFDRPGRNRITGMVKCDAITREWVEAFAQAKRLFDSNRAYWKGRAFMPVTPENLIQQFDLSRKGVETILVEHNESLGALLQGPDLSLLPLVEGEDFPNQSPAWVRMLFCRHHKLGGLEHFVPEVQEELRHHLTELASPAIGMSAEEISQLFNIDYTDVKQREEKELDAIEARFIASSELMGFAIEAASKGT